MPAPIWRAARAQEPGQSGARVGRRDRFCRRQPPPRRRIPAPVRAVLFLPGFFNIPPIDRDEARFAQATKQMVETGDFVDIRFQDDVRYKKPVGIYWLQAAAVETASALGLPRAQVRIWLYRVPSLIGAIGAVLLTYWAALAFVTRRGAVLAGLMLCGSVLLGVEARLAKTDAMLLLTVVAAMGALARVYLSWQRGEDPAHPPWAWPAIFWTALAGGILLKGPLILMFVALTSSRSRSSTVGGMAVAAAAALGPDVDAGPGAALVRADRLARGRRLFRQLDRRRMLGKLAAAGIARRAAGNLSAAVLGDVLAGLAACRARRAGDLAGAARPGAQFCWPGWCRPGSCSSGSHQAAALCAAALSGDRHPDRPGARATHPVTCAVDRARCVRGGSSVPVLVFGRTDRGRRDRADVQPVFLAWPFVRRP